MTPSTPQDDPYAGASQPAAEVASRAIGSAAQITGAERAQSDGYYTDGEGVRRRIVAGDAVPPGVKLEGTSAKAEPAGENKARKAPESK